METEKREIFQIAEAYSMQPMDFAIGKNLQGRIIAKIIEETIYIEGDPFSYYVGYDDKGKRLFEYKKGTVNVIYK